MVFEARNSVGRQYLGIGGIAFLSILGFILAGVIPTESTTNYGAYPILGWSWIAVCALLIAVLVGRSRDQTPQLRIDENGMWIRGRTKSPIPWEEITGTSLYRMPRGGYVLRVSLRDPTILHRGAFMSAYATLDKQLSGGDFGINPLNWDRSLQELVEALRHYRPDLAPA